MAPRYFEVPQYQISLNSDPLKVATRTVSVALEEHMTALVLNYTGTAVLNVWHSMRFVEKPERMKFSS